MLLRLADPDERYAAVRLRSDLAPLDYERAGEDWVLELGAAGGRTRLEYKLELVHADGGSERVLRPGQPAARARRVRREVGAAAARLRAAGVAGRAEGVEGAERGADRAGPRARRGRRRADLEPGRRRGPATPLPLLVANDGPEYDELAAAHALQRRR